MNTAVFEATAGRPGTVKQAFVSGQVVRETEAWGTEPNDARYPLARRPGGDVRLAGPRPVKASDLAEVAATEIERMQYQIRENVRLQLDQYGPGLDALGQVAAAADSNDPTAMSNATWNVASAIVGMAGPVGAAISGIMNLIKGLLDYLAGAYPSGRGEDPGKLVWKTFGPYEKAVELFRNGKRFPLWNVLRRGSLVGSYSYNPNEGFSGNYMWRDPGNNYMAGPGDLMWPRFYEGTEAQRWDSMYIACAPVRYFMAEKNSTCRTCPPPVEADPPMGYRSWKEWAKERPDTPAIIEASFERGRIIRDRIAKKGSPIYFADKFDCGGTYCTFWVSGFTFTVEGLPDETIVELITWLGSGSPDAQEAAAAVDWIGFDVEGATDRSSDPAYRTGLVWKDGLAEALKGTIGWSPYQGMHMKVLIDEYRRRKATGEWTYGTGAAKKKGLSTVAKVAIGVPVAAGAGWGLWKLGVALKWW